MFCLHGGWDNACTFTRHIHTEVDAIDWIHVDCARLHEHGRVPLSAFASC